jgi:SulP family sulfate permease
MVVGAASMLGVLASPRLTKAVPAAVLGVAAGVAAYFTLAIFDHSMLSLSAHRLIIGVLPLSADGTGSSSLLDSARRLPGADIERLAKPALTLSLLLSIDTLKTCVVTDALTRTRHDSNKELRAQGIANVVSSLIGGVPVAGAMGATMVNITSGGKTKASSLFEGVFLLACLFVFQPVVAWTPLAALGGILVVVGIRMVDWKAFTMLRQSSTRLDFVVIASVVGVAVGIGLITAAGVGLALAIMLFVRDQVQGSVIQRRTSGDRIFSKSHRLPDEMEVLVREGHQTVVLELKGNLFFGTTDQLMSLLSPI